ncbi:MAG: hypothetical protein VX768_04440 [Planctomycetota bacterium]|nr:hypothetical protein [Planctomycetota bacterium]
MVQKYGRTTGQTEGTIDSVNVSVNVGYDGGTAFFEDQIIFRGGKQKGRRYVSATFIESGDSVSLIIDSGNNPVELLFAGNNTVTIANPINTALDAFSDPQAGLMMFFDDVN